MEITFGYQKNLVICSNSELLKRIWSNSTNDKKILIPDLEVLPYDNFSPHPEVSSRRLIALRDLLKKIRLQLSLQFLLCFNHFLTKLVSILSILSSKKTKKLTEMS